MTVYYNISLPHLFHEEREQLHSCLHEYADLFAKGDSDLGSMDLVTHAIVASHPNSMVAAM